MWRAFAVRRAVLGMFLLLASCPAAGQSERSVSVEMSGISTFVVNESPPGLYVLYPNLADPSWLSSRFTFHPGDIAYHQLRIYFDKDPSFVPPGLVIGRAFPCRGEETRWWMVNATEDLPGMTFELPFTMQTIKASEGAPMLPTLNDEMFKANWPVPHRRVHPEFLDDALSLDDARRLSGRLFLAGLDMEDLEVEYLPDDYRLNGKVVKMPSKVIWQGRTGGAVKLCFRDLTAGGSDQSDHRCIEWSVEKGDLRLLFEHQPPHVRGLGCRGGQRDFVAHYAMLDGVGWLPSLPLPMIDTGKKGLPAFADDAMCSPAEGR